MKLRNVLAAFAASAVAASAMAISAFAATFSGTHSMADSTWWTQDVIMSVESGVPVSSLIGDLDPATVTSITFKSDTNFIIGFNCKDGTWYQSSNEGITEGTFDNILLESFTDSAGEEHDPYLHLCLSKGDGVTYTIDWTVDATGASTEPTEPAESTEPAPTEEPSAPTEEPAEATEEPADMTEESVESAESAEPTEEPVDITEEPVESAESAESTDTQTPATTPSTDSKGSPNTGVAGIAAAAGVAALAGVAVVVARKRK